MREIDPEIESLAMLALKNAYRTAFSELTNKFMEAAQGLKDVDLMEIQFSESTSVYGRDLEADGDFCPNIYMLKGNGYTTSCDTLIEALQADDAVEVYMTGKKIFELRNNDWFYVE